MLFVVFPLNADVMSTVLKKAYLRVCVYLPKQMIETDKPVLKVCFSLVFESESSLNGLI